MTKQKDIVLEEDAPFPPNQDVPVPKNEGEKKKEKKSADIDYLGLWISGKGGNEPVAYFSPEVEELAKEFAKANYGDKYIIAKVKLDSRPLITRANLRGAKNLCLQLLTNRKP